MKSTRIALTAAALLALLLLGGVAWAFSGLDERVRRAFEQRAAQRLQVPVRVGKVRTSLLSQRLEVDGLHIGNPDGFESDHFLTADTIRASFQLGSLLGSTFEIDDVEVRGVDVQLENRRGRFNHQQIARNVKGGAGPAGEASPGARMLHVARARVSGIRSTLSVTGAALRLPAVQLTLPDLELDDFGSGPDQRLPIEQVLQHFIEAVSRALLQQAAGSSSGGWGRVLQGFSESPTGEAPKLPEGLDEAVKGLDGLFRKP